MRQFLIAVALALGLVALWAALLPLTAQPAPRQAVLSPGMPQAVFLCHGPHGVDHVCAAALAHALVLDSIADAAAPANEQSCGMDQKLAGLDRRD